MLACPRDGGLHSHPRLITDALQCREDNLDELMNLQGLLVYSDKHRHPLAQRHHTHVPISPGGGATWHSNLSWG